jgi:hypothetical protein
MKKLSFRDIAELIGFTSVVGSLVFVGLELRQAQQATQVESSAIRAEWNIDNRNAINEHPEIWLKGNSGAQLSDTEQVIYSNLFRNFYTNNAFTWRRDKELGIERADFSAEEIAWFLYKHPGARREWESYMHEFSERRKALGREPSLGGFNEFVEAILERFDTKV